MRVQAHLVGQARDAQARQLAGDADRIERAEQVERAVLGAVGAGDAGDGPKAEQHRLGQAAALDHVEPVREQLGGLLRLLALPQRRGEQARQHAGERRAPAELALGTREGRPQQLLGEQHLAFPQVREADDEFAPAADVAERRAEVARRRLLLAQPGERGLAFEQGPERRAVRMHMQQQRIAQRRVVGPRIVQRGEAIRVIGEHRGAADDQRAFAAPRVVDAGLREDALDEPARLVMALAEREGPRGGQHQARPAVELAGRQPGHPVEHGALAAARHQRVVQAALGELVGLLRLPRRQRVARGRVDEAVRGEPVGGARMQRGLLVGGQAGEAAAQLLARERVHAQPVARLAGHEDRRVAREAGEPRGRIGIGHDRAAQRRVQVVEDRDPREEGAVGRIEIGQQQVHDMVAQRAAVHRHRRDFGLRIAAGRHHRERELQAERPAFGQLVQARDRIAVDARAEARLDQLHRLVQLKAQQLRRDARALAVVDQVVDVEMAIGAGRHDHAQIRRRVAQQVAEGVARGGGRRSASSTISTTSSALCATSATHVVMPSRPPGAAASSRVWPNVGRPAAVRTASASACTSRDGSSRLCADSHATTAPRARCSRRHCASSEVLPKPPGACTSTIGLSKRSLPACRRARAT